MTTLGLIPRNRLSLIPAHLRATHEYCYFLHDEAARLLCEYEAGSANVVKVSFPDKKAGKRFQRLATQFDAIEAMRKMGFGEEAKRVVLNQITLALTSDFLHHVFEGLRCLERRKSIVAFNVLRKPFKDNLAYLCWIVADQDDFYNVFVQGNPEEISQKRLGNKRRELFVKALGRTELVNIIDAGELHDVLFDRRRGDGLEVFFQHAVHLITTQHFELRTTSENFNFIFKNAADDDLYELAYAKLPSILLFSERIIAKAFQAMHPGDEKGHTAAAVRAIFGYRLIRDIDSSSILEAIKALEPEVKCSRCASPLVVSLYNALRIALTESYRCTACRTKVALPFSWMF